MSLYLFATGALTSDPQRREGANGPFTTATIRATGDEPVLVSLIAFGTDGERLFEYSKGDALAVSGRARMTSWPGRDGAEKHGISVVAEQIAAAKPRPKPRVPRASARPPARSSARSFCSAPRVSGDGADPPADPVDDLYADDQWPRTY
jgi:single-stranded DNA-binding protein